MGFKRPTYVVKFGPGHRFGPSSDFPEGLRVTTRSVPFEQMLEVQEAISRVPAETEASHEERMKDIRRVADLFSGAFVGWNLEEDDGAPVPATAAQLVKEGWDMVLAIVMGWMNMVSAPDEDLGKGSGSGEPSAVESIPMDVLSASPAS